MLKKRVIFTLLYDDGDFVLSRNFRLQKVGNLRWLQKNYNFSQIAFSIDELIILDVTRGERDVDKFHDHVRSLSEECFIPIAAGGGVRTVEHAYRLLRFGADKIVVNSLISECPEVVSDIAAEFGRQCIIASIDVQRTDGEFTVWSNNGTIQQNVSILELLDKVLMLSVGELYLNSIDRDGSGQGYQMEILDSIPDTFSIPIILSGGAGKYEHLSSGLNDKRVDAVATANLFNFIGDGLEKMRNRMIEENYNLPQWNAEIAREMCNVLHTRY